MARCALPPRPVVLWPGAPSHAHSLSTSSPSSGTKCSGSRFGTFDRLGGVTTSSGANDVLTGQLGLADTVVDAVVLARSVDRFRANGITLPTFAELADPSPPRPRPHRRRRPAAPPDARNLFRVHWYNDLAGGRVDVPDHVVLPRALTGVESPIIVVFGDRFPMISAHKVLAAYACLAPRVVTGQFDPTRHRAIWPSTGNYARGGVAISRIMGSRGVAVLPAGMTQERFDWLDRWVADPADIIRTPGSESNVKEIYDACNELAHDPANFVLNQFCEFGNHLAPLRGDRPGARARVRDRSPRRRAGLRLAAFVSATGSAGTIAAGDRLKEQLRHADRGRRGARVPDDARERLRRAQHPGHRRQAHPAHPQRDEHRRRVRRQRPGHRRARRAVQHRRRPRLPRRPPRSSTTTLLAALGHFGLSSICNVLAAIKTAKLLGLGPDDAVITVATDGAALYPSERAKTSPPASATGSATSTPPRCSGEHLGAIGTDAHDRLHRARSQPHLQPRLLHVGRAAGHTARGVRGAPLGAVLAGPAPLPRRLGRDDHRLQRARVAAPAS